MHQKPGMPEKLREVMTTDPDVLPGTATLIEAACKMRDGDYGDVLVVDENGELYGILTDRDIVIRAVAEGHPPDTTRVKDIATTHVVKLTEDDTVDNAIELMKRKGIRRIPIVAEGRPVGIVSLGDLSQDRDPNSALGRISAAPPQH